MTDQTPSDRVRDEIAGIVATVLEYAGDDADVDPFIADRVVEFLGANPSLLFDLAVEAGVLEETGKAGCTEYSDCRGGDHEWFFRFEDASDLDEDHPIWPVYRRADPSGGVDA